MACGELVLITLKMGAWNAPVNWTGLENKRRPHCPLQGTYRTRLEVGGKNKRGEQEE